MGPNSVSIVRIEETRNASFDIIHISVAASLEFVPATARYGPPSRIPSAIGKFPVIITAPFFSPK